MNNFIAALVIVSTAATLVSCNALETLAPALARARNFAFASKKLPAGTDLATARRWMELRAGGIEGLGPGYTREEYLEYHHADTVTTAGTEWYSGNKTNNTSFFRLRAIPQQLHIQVSDAITSHLAFPGHIGPTGATISILPLPQAGTTVTQGELRFFTTEDGRSSAEYVNSHDPNSYFRLTLDSLDMTHNVASGSFEGLAIAESGEHAGEIYAITSGEFLMDIRN